MNIEKRYWQWNEQLNETEFKLGADIRELVDRGIVKERSIDLQYRSDDESPCDIDVDHNGKIVSICYRKKFILEGEDIGNLHEKDFVNKVNLFLIETDKNYIGDKLSVVFRDSFLAIAVLQRQSTN